jgi:hypothetical protein
MSTITLPLAERREAVVVIHEILGVVRAGQPLALDAEVLGALGADGEHERVEAHPGQGLDGEIAALRDGHVPQVGDARIAEDLLELPAQAALHLVLVEEDPVLGEAARLDVAVDQDHAGALRGERAGGEETGGARADHRDQVDLFVRHLRVTIAHGPGGVNPRNTLTLSREGVLNESAFFNDDGAIPAQKPSASPSTSQRTRRRIRWPFRLPPASAGSFSAPRCCSSWG